MDARRRRMITFVFAALPLGLVGGATTACAEQNQWQRGTAVGSLAFVDVTVIPMDEPGILRNHTVLIEGGAITRVGPAATVPVPDSARVIDGSGRFLIPGLADMHVHVRSHEAFDLLLAHGIVLIREMYGRPWHLWVRQVIDQGGRTAPRVITAGPILEGTPPPHKADEVVTEGYVLVDDSAAAAQAVAEQAARRYDFVKVYNNLPAAAYAGIVAEARAQGLPVAGHVPFAVGLDGVFAAGQRSIEHLRGYIWHAVPVDAPVQPDIEYRSRLVAWRHADTSRFVALAERTARAGVWNTPTLILHQYVLPAGRIHELTERPAWRSCTPERWADPVAIRTQSRFYARMTDEDFQATAEGLDKRRALVRALHSAGGGLLAGTDFRPEGFTLHWELEELVEAGLTPWDALATATRNPARFLGQHDRYGTIAEGKAGDVVLLEADPTSDIRNTTDIAAVLVRGRLIERAELDKLIADACEAMRAR